MMGSKLVKIGCAIVVLLTIGMAVLPAPSASHNSSGMMMSAAVGRVAANARASGPAPSLLWYVGHKIASWFSPQFASTTQSVQTVGGLASGAGLTIVPSEFNGDVRSLERCRPVVSGRHG